MTISTHDTQTTGQTTRAMIERESRIAEELGIRWQPDSRPFRRDFELWAEAQEHQRGRMEAWARFRGAEGDGLEPYSCRHSDAWREGYWAVAGALRTRWAHESHRIDEELRQANQVLSASRYAYYTLHTLDWHTLECAYERVSQLTGQKVAWNLRMMDFVL